MRYFLVLVFLFTACTTESGQSSTTAGAATGGIVGAGLGAIVGNQTGDAGSGLTIGAMAGAGTGAAIGNAFDSQNKKIGQQSETIASQQKQIDAQATELSELRKQTTDSVRFDGSTAGVDAGASWWDRSSGGEQGARGSYAGTNEIKEAAVVTKEDMPEVANPAVEERFERGTFGGSTPSVGVRNAAVSTGGASAAMPRGKSFDPESKGSQDFQEPITSSQGAVTMIGETKTVVKPLAIAKPEKAKEKIVEEPAAEVAQEGKFASAECVEASGEAKSAKAASDVADKLFHFRRALRLCPENPQFHNSLGETYLTLSRNEDAEFEFQEALRVDPNYSPAKTNLSKVK